MLMLSLGLFSGFCFGFVIACVLVAGSRADESHRRIPRKQEQEAVAGELGAAELSVRHSVGDAA